MMESGSSNASLEQRNNDLEIFIRAIIDLEKYPALNDSQDEHIKCTFGEDSFHLEVTNPNTGDKYVLDMPRTREKIVAEKCKAYRRKTKIYVALYKQVVEFISLRCLICLLFFRKKKIGGPSKEFKRFCEQKKVNSFKINNIFLWL